MRATAMGAAGLVVCASLVAACGDSGAAGPDIDPPGFGTPSIDGTANAVEWANAQSFAVFGGDPNLDGSTLLVMNDDNNLYFAVRTPDPSLDPNDSFEVRFDNSGDELYTEGDDIVAITGASGFRDGHLAGQNYTEDAQQHGAGAIGAAGGAVHAELSHPLSSGDPDDISVSPGQEVAFCVRYLEKGGGGDNSAFPVACVLVVFGQKDWTRVTVVGR